MGNEKYTIRAEAPLLRPGLSIETEVSRRYTIDAMKAIMEIVRKFNDG